MKKLGLIGKTLGHSFSKKYYLEKFERENIRDIDYDLYELSAIEKFKELYESEPQLAGVNITIPYKEEALAYMDELSPEANEIRAINCVRIARNDGEIKLKGFNTDAYGFEESFKKQLLPSHKKALILGNGGATKAVIYVLNKLGIDFLIVSRKESADSITYAELSPELMKEHQIIINCSPVGTYPLIDASPDIPYEFISDQHYLYDLIYNPEETLFLRTGREKGAVTKNGLDMLILQAEKNWEIWNQE
ncbi:shikimate dehydrogenase family protein [Sphingobacterium hungaricum]|uniref:Shikimate dehydrogenase n=1 Tax=Sphingobacterium hungaricum TaxID=2082723 RepID=A0A928UZG1_9SPHI|nr:shikimate dehydrogenase [Sphingobacterium hungaricum]MBE8714201.1 shikimate dehydrogenase [Sphingobacterium hungaricum]